MILLEELKQNLSSYYPKLESLKIALSYTKTQEELLEYDKITGEADFWNDVENSQKVLQKIKILKHKTNSYDKLLSQYHDAMTMIEIAIDEQDEALIEEIQAMINQFTSDLEKQTLSTLLTGEYDSSNAIISFHSGAGGTEAQDWVEMLYRMYTRWAERQGYKYKVLDYLDGDEAGIKSASIMIEGPNAYGFLKSEVGVHRLVRISPFDSSGRRHTSFASIEVMPEITDDNQIDIKDDDLKIDTYRSGGAGGQHVNKTESAVRITHIPSGVVVACQNERSQHQNKEVAMKMLKAKLAEIKEREHLEKIEDIKGVQKDIAWGSQIRSYVFMPYTLVKDHRTNYESGNITAVMDGHIDEFITAYLQAKSNGDL